MNAASMLMRQLNKKLKSLKRLRLTTWTAILFTAGVSIWGNSVHAEHMDRVGKAISLLPPVLFIVAFELGSRIPIPDAQVWYRRALRPAATAMVAGIGAYLSYFHQRDAFALHTGNDEATARLLPLAIDGLMVVAAVCLYELNRRIGDLATQIEMEQMKAQAKAEGISSVPSVLRDPVTPGKENKRERVLLAYSQRPDLTHEQLASITGASVGYVKNLISELRKANGAELLPVG